jgi:hypothetical protein
LNIQGIAGDIFDVEYLLEVGAEVAGVDLERISPQFLAPDNQILDYLGS